MKELRKPSVLKSLKSTFLSFPEVAELLGVTERTIRDWIIREQLVEFRLHKLSRNRVKPIVATDQVIRLMNIKRPVFGTGSEQEQLWLENHEKRIKAGMASASARARKKEQQRP